MVNLKTINVAATLIIVSLITYILYIGKPILIPFFAAVVVWYIIITLAAAFESLKWGQLKIPFWLSLCLSILTTYFFIYFVFMLIGKSVYSIANEAPLYQEKMQTLILYFNEYAHLDLNLNEIISKIDLSEVFTDFALTLTSLAQNLLIIVIYVLLLLLEYGSFTDKLRGICADKVKYNQALTMFSAITSDINTYIKLKTFVSFTTGLLSYFVLSGFQIRDAAFWGVLIFLLNYIPIIGTVVAVLLTMLVISIQFTALTPFFIVGGILILIQILMGSIVEPKLAGHTLNLSPLATILLLAFWGKLWGIFGMFLCVPTMTIASIILARFDHTRPYAVLLTADGKLPINNQ